MLSFCLGLIKTALGHCGKPLNFFATCRLVIVSNLLSRSIFRAAFFRFGLNYGFKSHGHLNSWQTFHMLMRFTFGSFFVAKKFEWWLHQALIFKSSKGFKLAVSIVTALCFWFDCNWHFHQILAVFVYPAMKNNPQQNNFISQTTKQRNSVWRCCQFRAGDCDAPSSFWRDRQ